ncbi:MAG: hypothetical protein V4527_18920 [Pseudomonadota bacterium]
MTKTLLHIDQNRLAIGTRVRLVKTVDNFPTGIFDIGLTGTLKAIEDDCWWVTLDKPFPLLAEWENAIQIWDWSLDGRRPEEHPSTYVEAAP